MTTCPEKSILVEDRINRVLTQYRESPKLLHMMRTYLGQVSDALLSICAIPTFFDIDNSVGDQLTLLGKRMGWPRCHCVCNVQPVFGFECDGVTNDFPIAGFCEDGITWADCGPFGTSDICINDDETYRRFLKVRRYQMLSLYDLESLTEAIKIMWGSTAIVLDQGHGRVVIAFGKILSGAEKALLQLYPRVLPVAPGIQVRFHFGSLKVFGFGEGWGGFCDEWQPDGLSLETSSGDDIVTETGVPIMTGPLTRDAEWMCEIDPRPYDCAV